LSLVVDMMAALESVVRAAVPAIPAGALGVTRGFRAADELDGNEVPHLAIWDPTERPSALPYRQTRVECGLRLAVIRPATDTFNASAGDWESIRLAIDADPTLAGLVDACDVSLEAIQDPSSEALYRIAVIAAAAFKEF